MKNTVENTNIVDKRTRKWLLTINNPVDKGYSHYKIKDIITNMSNVLYYCLSDEIGEQGTYHTHLFICFASARKFSTMKNAFSGAHFDVAKGTCSQNRDYVFKEGKWLDDKKGETNLRDTHFEFGDMPIERQGKRTDLDDLYDMISSGMSDADILSVEPHFITYLDKFEKVRQSLLFNKFKNKWRDLDVYYVYGVTGSGKTRSIMEKYGYENVYRVCDYKHPFDEYKGQDVIIFEEFRSDLQLGNMLKYLEGYPIDLPCRYTNKCACFTKVYICTNIPLYMQYPNAQKSESESYKAFLRRISKVFKYTNNGVCECDVNDALIDVHSYKVELCDTPFQNIQQTLKII